MQTPRRRSAGRPAGPPDQVTDPTTPAPAAAPVTVSEGTEPGLGESSSGGTSDDQGASGGQTQHRRRQRAPKRAADGASPSRRQRTDPEFADEAIMTAASSRDDRRRGDSAVERSLRALVSLRSTQLPSTVAMRAREVAAPTEADLAQAEAEVVIVRRYYVPNAPLTTSKKGEQQPGARSAEARARSESRRSGRRPPRSTEA